MTRRARRRPRRTARSRCSAASRATSCAFSTSGPAMTYYETVGQNWERAALIKARPLAGDLTAARQFLAELQPYIWRRNLDFAAIEDIHSIKRQIQAHKG